MIQISRGPFLVSRCGALECSKRNGKEYYIRLFLQKLCIHIDSPRMAMEVGNP